MATKSFGTTLEESDQSRDYTAEIRKLAGGAQFPLTVVTNRDGELIGVNYETQWQEGSTEAVEAKDGTIENKADYKKQKLTKAQIKAIDDYVSENLVS